MFDSSKLKVGDVFYTVEEHNQAFHRMKIHREIDGEDWFKYDKPLRTYEIVTWELLGILRKELEGEWKREMDGVSFSLMTEYYLRYTNSTHTNTTTDDFYGDDENYFLDINEALSLKAKLETQAREMDKV